MFHITKTGPPVPQDFINEDRGASKGCYGIFPQVETCFRGVDNGVLFWNYTGLQPTGGVQYYALSESVADGPVLAADLVRPKASFQRQWQGEDWILVAATAHWLTFHHLRVIMVYPDESAPRSSVGYAPPKVVGRLDIRELDQYRIRTDKEDTYTVVKAHQASGRVFVGGDRGRVYECDYERQKLVPLELSLLDYTPRAARKTFVQLGQLANVFYQEVRQMAVDEARGLLYVLTADSWIRVFHIPPHAPSTIAYERDASIPYVDPPRAQGTVAKPPAPVLSVTVSPDSVDDRVMTLRTHRDVAALNRQDGQTTHSRRSVLPIVHVEPLPPTAGGSPLFLAVTHDGHRLFFTGQFGSSPFTPIQIGKPNPPTPAIRYEGPVSVELSKIHLPPMDSSIKVKDVFYAKGSSLIVSECPPSASITAAAAAAQLSPQQPLAPPPSLSGQQGPSPFAQQPHKPPHRTVMPQLQGQQGGQQMQQQRPALPPLSPSGGSDRDRQATGERKKRKRKGPRLAIQTDDLDANEDKKAPGVGTEAPPGTICIPGRGKLTVSNIKYAQDARTVAALAPTHMLNLVADRFDVVSDDELKRAGWDRTWMPDRKSIMGFMDTIEFVRDESRRFGSIIDEAMEWVVGTVFSTDNGEPHLLVNCEKGVSRSAAIAILTYAWFNVAELASAPPPERHPVEEDKIYELAYNQVKAQRQCAAPNIQLRQTCITYCNSMKDSDQLPSMAKLLHGPSSTKCADRRRPIRPALLLPDHDSVESPRRPGGAGKGTAIQLSLDEPMDACHPEETDDMPSPPPPPPPRRRAAPFSLALSLEAAAAEEETDRSDPLAPRTPTRRLLQGENDLSAGGDGDDAPPCPPPPRRREAKLSLEAAMDAYEPDDTAEAGDQGAAPSLVDEGHLQQGDSVDLIGGVGERGSLAAETQLPVASRPNNGLVGIAVDVRHMAQNRNAGLVTGRVSDSDHLQEASDLMDATQKGIAPLDAGWEVLAGSVVVPATECISYELPHIASLYSWAPMYLDQYNTTRRLEFHPRPPGSVQQQPRSGTPFAASMTRVPGALIALPDIATEQLLPPTSFVILSNSEVLHVTKTRPIDQLAHLMVSVSLEPPAAATDQDTVYGPPMQQDFQQFYNTHSPEQTCAMLWQLLCEWHRSATDTGLLCAPSRSPHTASVCRGLQYVSPLTYVSVPGVSGLDGGADQRVLEVLRRNLMTALLSSAYRMFHQSTGRGRDDKSPAGVLDMGQGTYSARLKGLYIYASALLRAIWDAPLFQVAKEGAMGIRMQPLDQSDTEWERFWGATFKKRRRTVGWLGGIRQGEQDGMVEGRFLPSLTPTFTPPQRQHLQAQLTNLATVIRENRQELEAMSPPNGPVLPYGMPPPQHQANPFVTSFYASQGGSEAHRHRRGRQKGSGSTTTPVQPPQEPELLESLLATLDSAIGVLNLCDIFDAPRLADVDRVLTPATFNRLADTTFKDMIMPSMRPPPPAPQAAPTQAPYPYPAGGQTGGGPDKKRQATADTEGRRADGRRGGVDGRAREGGAGPVGVVGEGVADLLQQLVLERVVDQNELRNRCPTLYTQLDADVQEVYLCLAAAKEHFARWERDGRPSGDISKMGSLRQWAREVNQAENVIEKHLPNPEIDIKTLLRKAEAAKAVRLFITMACERAKALDQHGVTARPSPPSAPIDQGVEQIYKAKEYCYSAILSLLEERILVPGDRCVYYPDELMIDFGAKPEGKPLRMTASVADRPAAAATDAAGGGKRKYEPTGVSVSEKERVGCVDRCRHIVQYCLRESADRQLHVMLFKWIIKHQQYDLHLHEFDSPYLAQWLLGLMEMKAHTDQLRQRGTPVATTAALVDSEALLKSIPPDELAKYYSRIGLFAEACACYMHLAIAPWPTRSIDPSFLAAEAGDSSPPHRVNPSEWNIPAPHIDSSTTVDQLLESADAAHFPSLADRCKFAAAASSYWEKAREQDQAGRAGVSMATGAVGGGVGGGGLTGQVPRVGSSPLLRRWERDNCQMAYKTVMLQSTMLAEIKESLRELLYDAKTHLNSDGTMASSSHRTDIHRTLLGAHAVQQSLWNAAHLHLLAWNLELYWTLLQLLLRMQQWPDDGQERIAFLVRHLMDQAIRRARKSGNDQNVVIELVERLCSSFSPTADSGTTSQRMWQAALPIVVLKLTDFAYSMRASVGGPYWWEWPIRVLWGPQADQSVNELCAEGLPTFRFSHLTICHALRNDMVRGEIRKLTSPDGRTAYDFPSLLRYHLVKHLLDIITKALDRSRVLAVHHRPGDTQRFLNDINAAHTEIKDLCDSHHSVIDDQALTALLRQVGELAGDVNRGRGKRRGADCVDSPDAPRPSKRMRMGCE
ncbi:unnamed protein product [Vitrella brassicaformis CCMP3155]|uniref:Nucleoporin Nup133/Nup155-like N-terminal domain-containing protein n=4 Tax=Vitrella brassicaformis TaxID=1169539 RepID=A0A0G4GF67_VITBC|nr:unnamed protein product [Vitrella brassicaformis CCMP3155]|eukprot:CEM28136.1 unnamed protein product [Vitrella brassicaformis CCMP3155]